jgi:hypothetical protein
MMPLFFRFLEVLVVCTAVVVIAIVYFTSKKEGP